MKGPQKGIRYPVTAEWQRQVRSKMANLKIDQKGLAAMIGCGQPSVSALLSVDAQNSTLVPAVHTALGWPLPFIPATYSVDTLEVVRIAQDLPDDVRDAWIAQGRAMVRALKK